MLRELMEKSFMVRLWSCIFDWLERVSPFSLVKKYLIYPLLNKVLQNKFRADDETKEQGWKDAGLLICCAFTIIFWIICRWVFVLYVVGVLWGILRLYHIGVRQVNITFFERYRAGPKRESKEEAPDYRRIVICLLILYFEIFFLFAIFYRTFAFLFKPLGTIRPSSCLGSLYFSVVTMTTLGYGDIRPETDWGAFICIMQTGIGISMALVVLNNFLRYLPEPKL